MCRNIKTLFNYDPPATNDEIAASALQFVRKLSGFTKPSKVNEVVFNQAVEDVAAVARRLVDDLKTTSEPKTERFKRQRHVHVRQRVSAMCPLAGDLSHGGQMMLVKPNQ